MGRTELPSHAALGAVARETRHQALRWKGLATIWPNLTTSRRAPCNAKPLSRWRVRAAIGLCILQERSSSSRHACCFLRVMNHGKKLAYTTRNDVLTLLSDEEVARVSSAETAAGLVAGDEYLDLEQLERGVLRAPGPSTPMGRVLPRKSVGDPTWRRILTALGASHPDTPPARS